jgi:hypothetical protein
MWEILRSQPTTCLFPFFVLALLFWALWTRHADIPPRAGRTRVCRNTSMESGASEEIYAAQSTAGRYPPALRRLHAACSAEYEVKFERVSERIRLPRA